MTRASGQRGGRWVVLVPCAAACEPLLAAGRAWRLFQHLLACLVRGRHVEL